MALNGEKGRGLFALVNDADFKFLNQWSWFLGESGYPTRQTSIGKKILIFRMHSILRPPVKGFVIDHADGNKLNNQKENLRYATPSQNSTNSKPPYDKKDSIYKGVCHSGKNFRAYIVINGKQKHLGNFHTETEAAVAYNVGAKKHLRKFAWLNDIKK